MGGRDQKKAEEDYEIFLSDLEEDPELRSGINLYKVSDVKMDRPEKVGVKKSRGKKVQYAIEVDESNVVPASAVAHDQEDVDEEADFPDVKLDELLEGFDELTLWTDGGAEDQVL